MSHADVGGHGLISNDNYLRIYSLLCGTVIPLIIDLIINTKIYKHVLIFFLIDEYEDREKDRRKRKELVIND